MKDQGYVAKIMGTASGLIYNNDRERTRVVDDGSTVRFKYIEPFDLHYKFRHAVDDHNNLRHAVPSIEGTWRTTRWAMRQFQFYLAVAEVNMYLAYRHWVWTDDGEEMPLLAFRRMLGWSMIRNELWNFQPQGLGQSLRGRQPLAVHVKQRCPPPSLRTGMATAGTPLPLLHTTNSLVVRGVARRGSEPTAVATQQSGYVMCIGLNTFMKVLSRWKGMTEVSQWDFLVWTWGSPLNFYYVLVK
jgi:hypothetical protein